MVRDTRLTLPGTVLHSGGGMDVNEHVWATRDGLRVGKRFVCACMTIAGSLQLSNSILGHGRAG